MVAGTGFKVPKSFWTEVELEGMGMPSNNYRHGSVWNDELELRCFLIFKQAEAVNFKRGVATELCRKLAKNKSLDEGTLKAKVGNYKSLAGYTKPTNASTATKTYYERYKNYSVQQIEEVLKGMG